MTSSLTQLEHKKKKKKKKRKSHKFTAEHCRNISQGRLSSPKLQIQKKATKERKELQKQIKAQIKAEEIERRGWVRNSPETRRKISEAKRGCVPWNKNKKGVMWNTNKPWPDTVKENISRGMVLFHLKRKQNKLLVTQ